MISPGLWMVPWANWVVADFTCVELNLVSAHGWFMARDYSLSFEGLLEDYVFFTETIENNQ